MTRKDYYTLVQFLKDIRSLVGTDTHVTITHILIAHIRLNNTSFNEKRFMKELGS